MYDGVQPVVRRYSAQARPRGTTPAPQRPAPSAVPPAVAADLQRALDDVAGRIRAVVPVRLHDAVAALVTAAATTSMRAGAQIGAHAAAKQYEAQLALLRRNNEELAAAGAELIQQRDAAAERNGQLAAATSEVIGERDRVKKQLAGKSRKSWKVERDPETGEITGLSSEA